MHTVIEALQPSSQEAYSSSNSRQAIALHFMNHQGPWFQLNIFFGTDAQDHQPEIYEVCKQDINTGQRRGTLKMDVKKRDMLPGRAFFAAWKNTEFRVGG